MVTAPKPRPPGYGSRVFWHQFGSIGPRKSEFCHVFYSSLTSISFLDAPNHARQQAHPTPQHPQHVRPPATPSLRRCAPARSTTRVTHRALSTPRERKGEGTKGESPGSTSNPPCSPSAPPTYGPNHTCIRDDQRAARAQPPTAHNHHPARPTALCAQHTPAGPRAQLTQGHPRAAHLSRAVYHSHLWLTCSAIAQRSPSHPPSPACSPPPARSPPSARSRTLSSASDNTPRALNTPCALPTSAHDAARCMLFGIFTYYFCDILSVCHPHGWPIAYATRVCAPISTVFDLTPR